MTQSNKYIIYTKFLLRSDKVDGVSPKAFSLFYINWTNHLEFKEKRIVIIN